MIDSRPPELLQVNGLTIEFMTDSGSIHAVNGATFEVRRGERVAIVGESGSGKSAAALGILRLLPDTARVGGTVIFDGQEVGDAHSDAVRRLRGAGIGMVYQDPFSSLNPVRAIGDQLAEAISAHRRVPPTEVRSLSVSLLTRVGLRDPQAIVRTYPHELSGGMRQRVVIAIAMAGSPRLLIADEPTTALDVTVQAQVLRLLVEATRREGSGLLIISHDLAVVAGVAERLYVMYGGRIVESGPTRELFHRPRHPYTSALLRSVPRLDATRTRLPVIEGQPPVIVGKLEGCPFAPRCSRRIERCGREFPDSVLADSDGGATEDATSRHELACWNPVESVSREAAYV